ncbi:MAG: hypothetical protein LZF86_110077 [Nitrospira sp.]|nr:MAG: hypothetical protein LZF86_110077 [Nitrospira sp.]
MVVYRLFQGALVAITLVLSGCGMSAWELKWGSDKPHISYASLDSGKDQADKIYVWNPNNNAAYVFHKDGQDPDKKEGEVKRLPVEVTGACMASADVAKARSYEGEIKLDLGKLADDASLEQKQKVLDTVTKLSERNEAASFLNVALFHICMMAGAGKIDQSQANTLMLKAIEEAPKVTKSSVVSK